MYRMNKSITNTFSFGFGFSDIEADAPPPVTTNDSSSDWGSSLSNQNSSVSHDVSDSDDDDDVNYLGASFMMSLADSEDDEEGVPGRGTFGPGGMQRRAPWPERQYRGGVLHLRRHPAELRDGFSKGRFRPMATRGLRARLEPRRQERKEGLGA